MNYRDTLGRFRKATDEERWPDPVEREHIQAIRELMTPPSWLMRDMARMLEQAIRDCSFVAGTQWERRSV